MFLQTLRFFQTCVVLWALAVPLGWVTFPVILQELDSLTLFPLTDSIYAVGGLVLDQFEVVLVWLAWRAMLRAGFHGLALRIRTSALDRWARRPVGLSPSTIRSSLAELSLPSLKPKQNHSHGAAASDRSVADYFCEHAARVLGKRPYAYQGSASSAKRGVAGSRDYHWSKDLSQRPRDDPILATDMLIMTDVDYYVDMPRLLVDNVNQYAIYTFIPERAAEDQGDCKFCFDRDGQVVMDVAGGAHYHHKLWNYGTDNLVASSGVGPFKRSVHYLVDKRRVSNDRYLVFLTPVAAYRGVASYFADDLTGSTLERFNPIRDGIVHFLSVENKGTFVCVGQPGSYLHARVSEANYESVRLAFKMAQQAPSTGFVKSHVIEPVTSGQANLIWHSLATEVRVVPIVYPLSQSVTRYQYVNQRSDVDYTAKTNVTPFMTPLYVAATSPDKTKGNAQQMVDGRILNPTPPTGSLGPRGWQYCNEFVDHLFPETFTKLIPADLETCAASYVKPAQRARVQQVLNAGDGRKVRNSTFQKSEGGKAITDPRPILNFDTGIVLEQSRYILPLSAYLKETCPFYSPGMTPRGVAETVAVIAERSTTLDISDFSRMDKHISEEHRDFELMVQYRAFDVSEHERIKTCAAQTHHLTVDAPFGIKFTTENQRGSGERGTTDFNTLDKSQIVYATYREQGLTPRAAWDSLCSKAVVGGDDGLVGDLDPKIHTRVAAHYGQQLDVQTMCRGDGQCPHFLARVYGPDVWFGDTNSMSDPARQLSKIHLTPHLPTSVTPAEKLLQKLFSYGLTDGNTPILGPYACGGLRAAERAGLKVKEDQYGIRTWNARFAENVQYPNKRAGWMVEYFDKVFNCNVGWAEGVIANHVDRALKDGSMKPLLEMPALIQERQIPLPAGAVALTGPNASSDFVPATKPLVPESGVHTSKQVGVKPALLSSPSSPTVTTTCPSAQPATVAPGNPCALSKTAQGNSGATSSGSRAVDVAKRAPPAGKPASGPAYAAKPAFGATSSKAWADAAVKAKVLVEQKRKAAPSPLAPQAKVEPGRKVSCGPITALAPEDLVAPAGDDVDWVALKRQTPRVDTATLPFAEIILLSRQAAAADVELQRARTAYAGRSPASAEVPCPADVVVPACAQPGMDNTGVQAPSSLVEVTNGVG